MTVLQFLLMILPTGAVAAPLVRRAAIKSHSLSHRSAIIIGVVLGVLVLAVIVFSCFIKGKKPSLLSLYRPKRQTQQQQTIPGQISARGPPQTATVTSL